MGNGKRGKVRGPAIAGGCDSDAHQHSSDQKRKGKGKHGGQKRAAKPGTANSCPSSSVGCGAQPQCPGRAAEADPAKSLPDAERAFVKHCRVTVPCRVGSSVDKKAEALAVQDAVSKIELYHMAILDNALTPDDIKAIYSEFEGLLDTRAGDTAIGEKDASKRSGTRMYNCRCQVGPSCGWSGWKAGSERTRCMLHDSGRSLSVWEKVCSSFGFQHIKRVEVVTSHPGCRNQGWHVDAVHGLTVIFPLVDVDVRKGPTQLDFTSPFNSVYPDRGKIKHRDPEAPPTVHAAMSAGSVLIFNANCTHRGTANISSFDRPILVLDCSPQCEHEAQSQWDL